MARTIATAFSMPLVERRMRWEAMMAKLRAGTIQDWFADFVDALQNAHAASAKASADVAPEDPPVVWPTRSFSSIVGNRFH
jgi:trehalose 6-phosphate synthase